MKDVNFVTIKGVIVPRYHGRRGTKVIKSPKDYTRRNKSWRNEL